MLGCEKPSGLIPRRKPSTFRGLQPDRLEPERTSGEMLRATVCGKEERQRSTRPQDEDGREVERVEGPHRGRHGERGALQNGSSERHRPECRFNQAEAFESACGLPHWTTVLCPSPRHGHRGV